MVSVVSEIIRMVSLLQELNVIVRIPIRLHFDRKATMQLATNPIFHERFKHIKVDLHFGSEK